MTMTELYPTLKQERSQSPTSKTNLSHLNGHDLSGSLRTKNESLAATPLSLAISTSTSMDISVKSEHDAAFDTCSPSQSPTLVADPTPQNFKPSPSPTPPPPTTDATSSKSSSPPLAAPSKSGKKAAAAPVQLIGDLPIAREEAVRTFNEIFDNNYQYKTLGRSREAFESMTCDCTYDHGVDSMDDACGAYSDCINRLTQVECLEDDCRCRSYCQNQRFQRKQYANIEIVLTEKKGYGLRAEEKLAKDTFIYEYVGDVVNPVSFKKRMREYAEEGIRHFYFMMLQKDEFIDATKSGGIGRFANHSCNPNCYVAKWTVGEYVRMGIFAKRDIMQYEELTFNYNVDRYGHQAQECFCGEPMCVGYIGGKTQTEGDIATMDDLYLDALGITDEQDLMDLKGTKKKKGKKIDDPDFMPTLKAVTEKEVPKVVQAIRQTTSRKVLFKLLTRIRMTEDQAALRQIMRLRGYSRMRDVLEDHSEDLELVTLALDCMKTWPLLNRNKVQDSKVNLPVEACAALENEAIKTLAQGLLDHWESLPVYNRIPKSRIPSWVWPSNKPTQGRSGSRKRSNSPDPFVEEPETRVREHIPKKVEIEKPKKDEQTQVRDEERRPKRRMLEQDHLPRTPTGQEFAERQAATVAYLKRMEMQRLQQKAKQESIKAIIASAAETTAAAEAALAAAAAEEKAKAEAAAEKAARRQERAQRKAMSAEDKEANKEKRLLKLVGAVIVKCMSKHSKSFDRDSFKKHAKELTQIIADKEKKSSSYKESRLDALSDEKVVKIKKFAKEYIAKVIRKLEKQNKMHSSSTSTTQDTPSTSMHTPNSHDGDVNNRPVPMSAEEAMGMDLDSGSEDEDDENDDDMNDGAPPQMSRQHLHSDPLSHPIPQSWGPEDMSMDTDDAPSYSNSFTMDPRRQLPTNG